MPKPYSHQALVDISIIYATLGVKYAVLSPGSRCAPLTLAFTRNPHIKTYTVSDERSAGFIALGMAQQTQKPVVVICTSGTAALNYGPAIAEAHFQQIPLLVLTADRPPEWIGQQDGQAIFQSNLHTLHTKKSFQLPADYTHPDAVWHIHRTASESFHVSDQFPQGAVHLNVPIREPFYPEESTELSFSNPVKVIRHTQSKRSLDKAEITTMVQKIEKKQNVLIVAGQQQFNEQLSEHLNQLPFTVVSDVVSNMQNVTHCITYQDLFLTPLLKKEQSILQPDLVISFGKSVISKNLKLFLRKFKPKEHWHIQEDGEVADTFQALTHVIRTSPDYFFAQLATKKWKEHHLAYRATWQNQDKIVEEVFQNSFKKEGFSELELCSEILGELPNGISLHLANSMTVRYANFLGVKGKAIETFANRGTSGIDGTVSTTVGNALASPQKQHILITGDLSLFYDRNAFWHNYTILNLKIILFNNHGGVIFKMINDPARQAEADEYFQTKQALSAKHLASEYGFNYLFSENRETFSKHLSSFFESHSNTVLWEISTNAAESVQFLKRLKNEISKKID